MFIVPPVYIPCDDYHHLLPSKFLIFTKNLDETIYCFNFNFSNHKLGWAYFCTFMNCFHIVWLSVGVVCLFFASAKWHWIFIDKVANILFHLLICHFTLLMACFLAKVFFFLESKIFFDIQLCRYLIHNYIMY